MVAFIGNDMATGVPKSKWNGDKLKLENSNNSQVFLSYPGKHPIHTVFNTSPKQYVPLYQSNNRINRLYYGENLNVLSTLVRDSEIMGQIELVYIDPPFATGSIFKSRKQDDAYTDLLKGADYVEFLRQRLILLRELLSDTGSIYIHLDAKMVFVIKLVMDEIFGESNFRTMITRKKCNPKNYTRKTYGNISDYILFYTKSDTYTWNRSYEPWAKADAEREYSCIDETTGRRYKKVPVHAPGTRNGKTGKAWRGMKPPPGKHWQYTPDKLDKMDARGEIYWSSTGNPRRKIFLDDSPGKPVQDIWLDVKDAHNQNIRITGYPTEKNPSLLERIIKASSNPEDIVMDCFCGSGTSLAVASRLTRRWIGVDNSSHAISTTLKRFAIGMKLMGDFVSQRDEIEKTPQMSLFTPDNEPVDKKISEIGHEDQIVKDFSLYCEAGLDGELREVLNEWVKIMESSGGTG